MDDRPRRPLRTVADRLAAIVAILAAGIALGRPRRPGPDQPQLPAIVQDRSRPALLAQGWGEPAPARLIKPSYWPFVFGLGITFLLGGIATIYLVSGVGLIIFAVGFIGWMRDLLEEQDYG